MGENKVNEMKDEITADGISADMAEPKQTVSEENVAQETSGAEINDIEDLPVLEAESKIEEEENKRHSPKGKIKKVFHKVFSIWDDIDTHENIRAKMISGSKITGTNAFILFCAILIASIGLNGDSVAVIIGAMLISPIMGTIMGAGYATVSADMETAKKSLLGFGIQVSISLAVSTLFFLISPIKDPNPSLLARTSPTYFDVIIALAGGTAGVLAQTRKNEYSNVIPGVAIATALMPPLCTCGWALANGRWTDLLGAFYLFVINAYFIYLSTVIMLTVMATPKVRTLTMRQWRRVRRRIQITTLITLIPFILLAIYRILQVNGVVSNESNFPTLGFLSMWPNLIC